MCDITLCAVWLTSDSYGRLFLKYAMIPISHASLTDLCVVNRSHQWATHWYMRHCSLIMRHHSLIYASLLTDYASWHLCHDPHIQPITDRVALNLEIIFKTFSTNQNSAHGIYDWYQVTNDQSHENPGTPGTKSKVFRNNLKMLCHPTCNWLYHAWVTDVCVVTTQL